MSKAGTAPCWFWEDLERDMPCARTVGGTGGHAVAEVTSPSNFAAVGAYRLQQVIR
jgi:hypothetical protein